MNETKKKKIFFTIWGIDLILVILKLFGLISISWGLIGLIFFIPAIINILIFSFYGPN